MEIILIVTLLVLLFFKWIVFALLALPLKVVLLMKKEKDAAKVAGRKTDLSVLGDPISGYKLSLIQIFGVSTLRRGVSSIMVRKFATIICSP